MAATGTSQIQLWFVTKLRNLASKVKDQFICCGGAGMRHYATLRDHKFRGEVNDIRGAILYGDGSQKLGKIEDVLFEHDMGDIEYLVANEGHGRKVLVPIGAVRRSTRNDRDFESGLTKEDIHRLPAFDERTLRNDSEWSNYLSLHHLALEEGDAGRDDSSEMAVHAITPTEPPRSRLNVTSIDRNRRDDYVPELTPNRLAPIFTRTAQTSDNMTMAPKTGLSRDTGVTTELGPKWDEYQEKLRRDLPRLRASCETCRREKRKIA